SNSQMALSEIVCWLLYACISGFIFVKSAKVNDFNRLHLLYAAAFLPALLVCRASAYHGIRVFGEPIKVIKLKEYAMHHFLFPIRSGWLSFINMKFGYGYKISFRVPERKLFS